MKAFPTTLALLAIFICTAMAGAPKKVPLYQYASLWTDSPFTADPDPVAPPPANNPLDDFTLTGIAPVPGGYRVTIISKKDPTVKEVISPNSDGPFRVISVNRNPGKSLGTTVVLSNGSMQGTVSFEPDLITVNSAPPAPVPTSNDNSQQPPNIPPGANTPNNGQQNAGPRPRIVPPAPQNDSQRNNNSNNRNSDSPRRERR